MEVPKRLHQFFGVAPRPLHESPNNGIVRHFSAGRKANGAFLDLLATLPLAALEIPTPFSNKRNEKSKAIQLDG